MNIVLITGVTSGIGEACVKKFSEKGYYIIGIARNRNKLKKVKLQSLKSGAKNFKEIVCNFNNINNINKVFEKIKSIKKIDCVVNCAGVAYKDKIAKLSIGKWNSLMQINVTIPFLIIKKSIKFLVNSKNPFIKNKTKMKTEFNIHE